MKKTAEQTEQQLRDDVRFLLRQLYLIEHAQDRNGIDAVAKRHRFNPFKE